MKCSASDSDESDARSVAYGVQLQREDLNVSNETPDRISLQVKQQGQGAQELL